MSYWAEYWEGRRDGGHRSSDQQFLDRESAEKRFHLDGGTHLLDFGCGAAELLVRLAPDYEVAVGVERSASMLDAAAELVASFAGCEHVRLVRGDERTAWSDLPMFDRIATAGVVQYFTAATWRDFLAGAVEHLSPGGRIVLFDIIDPRLLYLVERGALRPDGSGRPSVVRLAVRGARLLARRLPAKVRGVPAREMGYPWSPQEVRAFAAEAGLHADFVSSMYYEYRYHAVLTR